MKTKRINSEENNLVEGNARDYSLLGTIGAVATGLLSGIYLTDLNSRSTTLLDYVTNHPYESLGTFILGASSIGLLALSSHEREITKAEDRNTKR